VQAAAGTRSFTGDLSDALKHELADCLWSVLVIAKELDVDLASAFDSTMNELNERVAAQLEAS
jgi:NTP pyrophosphatase (non-canonical NTP hydrolase)